MVISAKLQHLYIASIDVKPKNEKTTTLASTTADETAKVIDVDKESDQSMAKRRTGDTVDEWVHIGKISLKNSDKMILLQGDKLNDYLHFNACQLI